MKTPIKRIVLDLGGKEIELTLEQAKTLFGALEEMFGAKTVSPIVIQHQRWYWDYPQPYWQPATITCGTGSFPPGTITYTNGTSEPNINSVTAQMQDSGTLRLIC